MSYLLLGEVPVVYHLFPPRTQRSMLSRISLVPVRWPFNNVHGIITSNPLLMVNDESHIGESTQGDPLTGGRRLHVKITLN